MQTEQVVQRIEGALPGAEVSVEGEDCSFSVVVLSPEFAGLPVVKRQQKVLAAFSTELQTGELHALTVKAHTPEEWKSFQQAGLTQIEM
ncbi:MULTISPECIES: BolA family protein [unclassified Ketobacter]|uniref:BolA family protein n=1 Tax=unclassified Ketobacter TaxID=2639109 RepID=UPI000F1AF26F|nr:MULTISPECIES: BolA/IbaG family iron-sulfur metabolism protein [unclassified Ketobacter]RLT90835.1 MAG: BolA/IbaG family iron-sulfur metabolism protein [Ketobacter sp. GenoA1]RLT94690.1 MAG: BolA/IbaG family iron-sulfur metabolism protein [Ketobacter sp.]